MQDACLLDSFQPYAPSALVARQVGAYFPQADFFTYTDNPLCYVVQDDGHVGWPPGGELMKRRNLDEIIRNIAVPWAKVQDILNTPGYLGIFPHSIILDPNLTLEGLRLVWDLNH